MRKKILSWLLIFSVIIGMGSGKNLVQAEVLPEVVLDDTQVEVYYLRENGKPSSYGYQDYEWVDENGVPLSEEEEQDSLNPYMDPIVESVVLPASYDMRNVNGVNLLPPIRNQKSFGTCWAHAALASVETNMIKKGYVNSGVDYAERHLAYFSHTKNAALGDGADKVSGNYGKYCGGNAQQATGTLAGWYGAAEETAFPYEGCSATDTIDEKYRTSSVAHLTASNQLKEASDIKKAIMQVGAVQGSYYAADTDGKYVYRTGRTDTNHAISIVGWDDNLDKSNFSYSGSTPADNGAWLCRNSWGSNWGDSGYFWISYEDETLSSFWSYEAEPANLHKYIYQYDGAGYGGFAIGYPKAANAFTAESDQMLNQIGFYTWASDTYTIEVFLGEEEVVSANDRTYYKFPKTPEVTVEGQTEYGGYHTVDLGEEVFLEKDQRFLVVITLESTRFLVEYGKEYTITAGQSYFRVGTLGGEALWQDVIDNANEFGNVCIKAITDDAPEHIAREIVAEDMKYTYSAEDISSKTMLESHLPQKISVVTKLEPETKSDVSVVWTTEDAFVERGRTYHYIGTLQSDDNVYVPKSLRTVSAEIVVEPVVVPKPEFSEARIPLQEDMTAAGVEELTTEVLPESGKTKVGKSKEIEYTIQWDERQKIDLSNPEAVVEFEGIISYLEPENWMTLPEDSSVSRTVSVEEPEKYQITLPIGTGFEAVSEAGYDAGKVYDGRNYKFKLNEKDGYDISSVTVSVNGVEIEPKNGVYTLEEVTQNIADITVSNVRLSDTCYKKERTVDNRMKITPLAPATAVKLVDETAYHSSITVSGLEDIEILLRDEEGNESREITVEKLGELVLNAPVTDIPKCQVVTADKMYSLQELENIYLPEKVLFSTLEGIQWSMSVLWKTEDVYNVKGGTYHYVGTLLDDGVCANCEDIPLEAMIQVEPVRILPPQFPEQKLPLQKGVIATASEIGMEVFPVVGTSKVNDEAEVSYQITWEETQNIDLGKEGASATFYGKISYFDVPQWLTLPETDEVSRKVRVSACSHTNKETRNKKNAAEGQVGYTGDIYCLNCEKLLVLGKVIPALKIPEKELTVGSVFQNKDFKYVITAKDSVAFLGITGNLKTVKIPATVEIYGTSYKITTIKKNAFKNNKKITSVTIGKNITAIEEGAFYNCTGLKTIRIPDNVKTIGTRAFYGCKKLKSVTIGKSVSSIGKEAFLNCRKLESVKIKSLKLKKVGKNALKGMKSTGKISVPAKKLSAYKKLLKNKGQNRKVKIKK